MKKIPNKKLPKKYSNNDYINEELVEIDSSTGIIVDMQYPKLNLKHSINKCLVRKTVYDKLMEAKKYLPDGIVFKILDAYRPIELQKELYDLYKSSIIKTFNLENKSIDEQDKVIKNYISLPNNNEIPPHSTGGAIDIILADEKTHKHIDLGTKFDSFSEKVHTNYFEEHKIDENIKNNRRILYNALTKVGFTNLPSEYWHYDYGNKNWAYYNNKPAIYNKIDIN